MDLVRELFGYGIFVVDGEAWKTKRKVSFVLFVVFLVFFDFEYFDFWMLC
jgi:hypothetical protein